MNKPIRFLVMIAVAFLGASSQALAGQIAGEVSDSDREKSQDISCQKPLSVSLAVEKQPELVANKTKDIVGNMLRMRDFFNQGFAAHCEPNHKNIWGESFQQAREKAKENLADLAAWLDQTMADLPPPQNSLGSDIHFPILLPLDLSEEIEGYVQSIAGLRLDGCQAKLVLGCQYIANRFALGQPIIAKYSENLGTWLDQVKIDEISTAYEEEHPSVRLKKASADTQEAIQSYKNSLEELGLAAKELIQTSKDAGQAWEDAGQAWEKADRALR